MAAENWAAMGRKRTAEKKKTHRNMEMTSLKEEKDSMHKYRFETERETHKAELKCDI